MPVLLLILFAITVCVVMKFVVNPIIARRDAKQSQMSIDKNVEWQLNEGRFEEVTIEMLARHSDKEKIARIVSTRIFDLIALAIHPQKLSKILQNLGQFTATRNQWSTDEINLSALIQQYTLRDLDSHNMEVYMIEVSNDKKRGFSELNNSFLTKVNKNMLVWSPSN